MSGLRISIRADVSALSRELDTFKARQLPYATKLALDALAAKAQAAERAEMARDLDRPRSFTLQGVKIQRATKGFPVARIFIADIQARYLAPVILGGKQVLGKSRGVIKPVDIKLDQFGNIPKGKLAALKARPDIFIGAVHTTKGDINGVWQRLPYKRGQEKFQRGNFRGRLKLLIRFANPATVKTRYRWGAATARLLTPQTVRAELDAALKAALATAR